MVVNGSLSKTAVNGSAGARTQVSGLTVAVLTVVTLLFLTGLFEQLPEAVLAAVVIVAVIELVDVAALRALYGVWTRRLGSIYGPAARADFAAAIATLLGVLVFDTLPGLFIGIAVSLLLLLYRASRPNVAVLARAHRSPGRGCGSTSPATRTAPRRPVCLWRGWRAACSSPTPTTSASGSAPLPWSTRPRRSCSTRRRCRSSTSPPRPCCGSSAPISNGTASGSSWPATSARCATCSRTPAALSLAYPTVDEAVAAALDPRTPS